MTIEPLKVVGLQYELFDGGPEGKSIEKVQSENPFIFLFGLEGMLPRFESNIRGMKAGDEFSFLIPAAEAYGEHDPEHLADLPIENFIIDGVLQKEMLEIGNVIRLRGEDDSIILGQVKAVQEKTVSMDFNHQLAGINLFFKGKVLSVRDASTEELDHGHAHGPDGHHHSH